MIKAFGACSRYRLSGFFTLAIVLLPVAMVLGLLPQTVHAQAYSSAWETSQWQLSAGPFSCQLRHNIPDFGVAQLHRAAGKPEVLTLRPKSGAGFTGEVSYAALPMPWRSDQQPQQFGRVNAVSGGLSIAEADIPALVAQLQQGLQLVFSQHSRQVSLLPRNFTKAYQGYRQCVSQLIPYTFAQLARITLHYPAEAPALGRSAKAELDKVARYTQADKNVLGILIDAHSDARSSAADSSELSRQQAELVALYLSDKGIAPALITQRWHGEQYPVASNDGEQGRAQNRRVTLRLENADTRAQMAARVAQLQARQAELREAAAQQAANELADAAQVPVSDQVAMPGSPQTAVTPAAATSSAAAGVVTLRDGFTLKDLERLVESMDLTSASQPQVEAAAK